MLSPLKSLMCRHDFFWSERSGCDRCRRCGARRDHSAEAAAQGDEFAIPAIDSPAVPPPPPVQSSPSVFQPTVVEWSQQPASTEGSVFERPRPVSAPQPPTLVAPSEPRDALLARLDALTAGSTLSRNQTLELVLAIIEDTQSSEPVLVGMVAADYFARLHAATRP
jgi:hypothetical protein